MQRLKIRRSVSHQRLNPPSRHTIWNLINLDVDRCHFYLLDHGSFFCSVVNVVLVENVQRAIVTFSSPLAQKIWNLKQKAKIKMITSKWGILNLFGFLILVIIDDYVFSSGDNVLS